MLESGATVQTQLTLNIFMSHICQGEGSFGSIVKGRIHGTPVTVKTSRNTLMQQHGAPLNESATSDPEEATTAKLTTSKTNFKGKLGAGLQYPHFIMDRRKIYPFWSNSVIHMSFKRWGL
jgi:hypothetical protein